MLKRRVREVAGLTLTAIRKVVGKLSATVQQDRMLDAAHAHAVQRDDGSLAGKRVLVTGSTRGIGRALAIAFVQQGASVVVHGRDEAAARKAAAEILDAAAPKQPQLKVVGLGADLSAPGAGRALVEQAVRALGGIDLVINNAAIHDAKRKPFWSTSSDEMQRILAINLLAPFDVSAAAVASMLAQGIPGRIINLSTGAADPAKVGDGGIASYGISKMGLEGMSQYLAAEARTVTVVTLRPDTIDTDMVEPLFPTEQRWRMLPPESMVAPTLFLARAPRQQVHGRIFEQLQVVKALAESESGTPTVESIGFDPRVAATQARASIEQLSQT
ncbi:MAG: SDR family oxidoreductase [Polyangiales bacterium]